MSRSVGEWVGKNDDEDVPPRVKRRVWLKAGGCCENCGRKTGPGLRGDTDHIIPLEKGGPNRESNLQLLCVQCHKDKTRDEVAEKAKVARTQNKHLGFVKKRQGFRAWRKFDGTIVYKEDEE
jgi:5-methylcytosine-specific restriction endonuclease McrA